MKTVVFALLIMVFSVCSLCAAPVDDEQIQQVAEHWLASSQVFQQEMSRTGQSFSIKKIGPIRTSDNSSVMAWHIALNPVGYIVVSTDDRMYPVLCFSTESDLNLTEQPENALRKLLFDDLEVCEGVLQRLDAENALNLAENAINTDFLAENQSAWAELLDFRQLDYDPTNILVDVMIETRWSQWNHYNELCPVDPAPGSSYDGRVPVGCVAAAGAQLMKYYEWPSHGWGGHSYTDSNPSVTGAHSADFSDPYDWDNMLTGYYAYGYVPLTQELAVSELIYEVGVAVEMDYGSYGNDGGSAASINDLGSSLSSSFFYEPHIYLTRSNDVAYFDQAMRDAIFAGDPVIVSISNHAIIADGLSSDAQTNFFHINYGWGGINDGWYLPSNINGADLYKGVFGSKPAFMPLLTDFGGVTNTSGIVTNTWVFPDCRLSELDHYQLEQGQYMPTNIMDTGQRYDAWEQSGSPWTNLASGGYPGSCYFKPNVTSSGAGTMMSEPFIPAVDTVLSFDYKAVLYTDHFYVEISDDSGINWDVLLHETDYPNGITNGWWEGHFPLGGYAGRECLLRFRYATGGYWSNQGIYVDNISYSNLETLSWTVVDANISSNATGYVVSNLTDGTYYYALTAANGVGLQDAGPMVFVTVLLPDDDCDDDGIPDAWELAYFGSVTGATEDVDADGDFFTNWEEWRTGSNPTNASSFFAVEMVTPASEGVAISWPTISNRTYSLYRGTNLCPSVFMCIQSNIASTPPINTYSDTNAPSAAQLFYCVATE